MNSVRASASNRWGLVFRAWQLAVILPALLLVCCTCAFALDPSLDISQYAHTAWKVRDGFTRGEIRAIAQTPDGYLWLGTEFGLMRFDGVRAAPWQPPLGEPLPSDTIDALLGARDGTLWIGTARGLASWKDGKLNAYPAMDGQQIASLLEDHEGSVWASGNRQPNLAKLCAFRKTGAECYGGDGRLGIGLPALYEDSKGTLWVGAQQGFWRWRPGPPAFFPVTADSYGVRELIEDDKGALLVGTKEGIGRFVDGRITIEPLPGERSLLAGAKRQPLRILGMLRDRDDCLWIGTYDHGLIHLHEGRSDTFSQADGLSSDLIARIFEDREGTSGFRPRADWIGFALAPFPPSRTSRACRATL